MTAVKYCLEVEYGLVFLAFRCDELRFSQGYFKFSRLCPSCRCFVAALPSSPKSSAKCPTLASALFRLQRRLRSVIGVQKTWPIHKTRSSRPNNSLQEVTRSGEKDPQQGPNTYHRGLLLGLSSSSAPLLKEISQACAEYSFRLDFEVHRNETGGETVPLMEEGDQKAAIVTPVELSRTIHPAFNQGSNNYVFHSLKEALAVLNKCSTDEAGISELQHAFRTNFVSDSENKLITKPHKPLIVVEGLDATGKSTLVARLKKELCAAQLGTPPEALTHLREAFDDHPPLLRRVFYSLGNYLAAQEILKQSETVPVVMDRFWHSTAAYTIATDCGTGGPDSLPPAQHPVYKWPSDLINPTLVLLLKVSEVVRLERISSRVDTTGIKMTAEEMQLEENIRFAQSIQTAYQRIHGVRVVELPADGDRDTVTREAMKVIEHVMSE